MKLGTAARHNAGKPRLDLIPASIMAEASDCDLPSGENDWLRALSLIGAFQMRATGGLDRPMLLEALRALNGDGRIWIDCAAVFEYGLTKYSAWNWAAGQDWSKPIASALRHIVLGVLRGEADDPESGLPHRGHVACNIVMLLWFMVEYPQGDDRIVR